MHEGIECDGCQAFPIQGIRYKCSVCGNVDLCEACEDAGVHSEHTLLKIRRPIQAPVKLICQYRGTNNVDPGLFLAQAMSGA